LKKRNLLSRIATTALVLQRRRAASRLLYEPLDRIHAVRDARVRELVAHAAVTVPHYRELWRREGIDPAALRTAADLDRLPIAEKADLRTAAGSFRSEARDAAAAICVRGSGSTGIPVEVWHDAGSLLTNAVLGGREAAIVSAVCGTHRVRTLRFGHPVGTMNQVGPANRCLLVTPRKMSPPISVEEPLERAVAAIETVRPDLVTGYGSYLETLFRTIGDPGGLRHRPRAVRYHGDSMSESGRRLIEEDFGIPVLATYNAVECFRIGEMCEARTGYHLHTDVCHVSIVNREGTPLAAGEEGEVVISNLFNRATVLLNYRLGDIAAIDPEPCPCGRTTHRLVGLSGRMDEILVLPSGTRVHPYSVSAAVRELPGYRQYQLVQLAADHFELRLVTDSDEAFSQAAAAAVPPLAAVLEGARVDAVRSGSLDTSGRGKLRRVIPLVKGPGG
jgi:phenylacetate-CoA ligase